MKINVRLFPGATPFEISPKGDWIDVRANEDFVALNPAMAPHVIPLGFAMALPKGYEAILNPRSSTPKKFNVICGNSQGVIDNSYSGNNDQWGFCVLPLGRVDIHKGDRIAQFRIQLSQKATMWQKIKWLLTNGKIEFAYVDDLGNPDRHGWGSSGRK